MSISLHNPICQNTHARLTSVTTKSNKTTWRTTCESGEYHPTTTLPISSPNPSNPPYTLHAKHCAPLHILTSHLTSPTKTIHNMAVYAVQSTGTLAPFSVCPLGSLNSLVVYPFGPFSGCPLVSQERPGPDRNAPHRTRPHRTAPHQTASHRIRTHGIVPHCTAPDHTGPDRTAPDRTGLHRQFVFGQSGRRHFFVRPAFRSCIYRCTLGADTRTLGAGRTPSLSRHAPVPPGSPARPGPLALRQYFSLSDFQPPLPTSADTLGAAVSHSTLPALPAYRHTTPNILQLPDAPPALPAPRPFYPTLEPSRPSPHMDYVSLGPQPGRVATA
jgi:hypothetical protein